MTRATIAGSDAASSRGGSLPESAMDRPGGWVWILPPAYALHIAEEYFVGSGFYTWVAEFAAFSARSFLGVNFMIISLVAIAVWLARTRAWGGFLVIAVATQFLLHAAFVHPATTAWAREPSPGLLTGLLVLLPLAVAGFRWGAVTLDGRALRTGLAAGVLLFASQDLWRVLFNQIV